MFPPLIISVPLYPVLNKLNLTDKHIVLILLYTTFEITIITLIMKSFIDSIPIEIEEAARLDGANISAIFLYIILPLLILGFLRVSYCSIISMLIFFKL